MTRSPSYGGAVLLALGPSTVDVADRALVVAVLPPTPPDDLAGCAERAATEGADVLEVADGEAVAAARARVALAVAVRTPTADTARAAFDAGAVLALDPGGLVDGAYLAAARETGASVVAAVAVPADDPAGAVAALRAVVARVTDAGVAAHHLAVEPVASPGAGLRVPGGRGLRCVGVPVVVSVVRPDAGVGADVGAVAGPLSVAVVRGAGLVRVAPADVRSARRVVDVLAAVRRGRP